MATIGILDEYISRRDLAAQLGKRFETLIRWERDGVGPPVTRLGRQVLYSRKSLQQWLEAQEQPLKPRTSNHASAA